MGCSLAGEAVNPTPVSMLPDAVRPVIAGTPGPARPRPAGADAFQVVPSGDVQITTSCWPGVVPKVPVPAKPPSAAASAVTCMLPAVVRVVAPGIGRAGSFRLAPPSADWTADGPCPPPG